MNKREHVVNAVLVGAGIGYMLEPGTGSATLQSVARVTVPVTLGTMIPDIDTSIGEHRKTFHNLLTFVVFAIFPVAFNNLKWVWLGILSHYILDLLGTHRGMALLYPLTGEFRIPVGVPVNSLLAPFVTLIVTFATLGVAWLLLDTGALHLLPAGFAGLV